jgi:hypothetical protein
MNVGVSVVGYNLYQNGIVQGVTNHSLNVCIGSKNFGTRCSLSLWIYVVMTVKLKPHIIACLSNKLQGIHTLRILFCNCSSFLQFIGE